MLTFVAASTVPLPAPEVYRWHQRPGAFERLSPPWVNVDVLRREGSIDSGRVHLRFSFGPFSMDWIAEHFGGVPDREFRDRLVQGPVSHWEHIHRFVPLADAQCRMEDEIHYELPRLLGPVAATLDRFFLRPRLVQLFAYRHRIVRGDLLIHQRSGARPLRFLVSGASGLVGSALCPFLTTGGHRVSRLVRREARAADEVSWDPASGRIKLDAGHTYDVVVHLAGANIGRGRWDNAYKEEIRRSRVDATRKLARALAGLPEKPKVLVSASAIGFYGDRGNEAVDENAAPGRGFLAEVCRAWEEATEPAHRAGIRVVNLRIGVVLTPAGGALAQMLPLFRLGLGGRVGSGAQYVSWIAPDDLCAAILHCAVVDALSGPVNAVAPNPAPNAELGRTLARVLHRPALLPAPATALRVALGEMAEELLLSSTRVWPRRLLESGFHFQYPDLESALRHVLGATHGPLATVA